MMIKFRITKEREKEEDTIKQPQQKPLSFFLSIKPYFLWIRAYVKRTEFRVQKYADKGGFPLSLKFYIRAKHESVPLETWKFSKNFPSLKWLYKGENRPIAAFSLVETLTPRRGSTRGNRANRGFFPCRDTYSSERLYKGEQGQPWVLPL